MDEMWPPLPYAEWRETCRTLHLWSQIVGKVRLTRTPWLNHSWQTPFYVTPRGLSSSLIPHDAHPFDVEFDFIEHALHVRTDGPVMSLPLAPMSVAEFHAAVMAALAALGVPVTIDPAPNELAEAVPFPDDHRPRTYDAGHARRFLRVLHRADELLKRFRTGFLGKASPVHFFWGGFDLAVTRFSGRPAPPHPGGVPHLPDAVTREAYSHEVSSAGFWPGGPGLEEAVFYSYAYPEPPGFRAAQVAPAEARYEPALGEFVLPYVGARAAPDPDAAVMAFLMSTYVAAAQAAGWDRPALECAPGEPARPRRV